MRLRTGFLSGAAALAAVAAAASAGPAGAGDSGCASGWPVVRGVPATLRGSAPGYFVWRRGPEWHLAVRGDGRTSAFAGRVSASGPVRLLGAAARGVTVSSGVLTFAFRDVRATRTVVFTAPCAGTTQFRLGAAGTAAQPSVYLGSTGRAPAPSFAVSRTGATGVHGVVERGPLCPVLPCDEPARPVQGTVQISTAAGTKSDASAGTPIATVASDAAGSFAVSLKPGRYVVLATPATGAASKPTVFTVVQGVSTEIVVVLDTGIRGPTR